VSVCGLTGASFWTSSMAIDCDGIMTAECNINADPDYQDQTAVTDSQGNALNAAVLPYVVIPTPSATFSYQAANIQPGAVVAVLYQGQLVFGVFGDVGPTGTIGEASYAMAQDLGIDPNPSTGGAPSGVTFIAFSGATAVVSPVESHTAAVTLGTTLAGQLVADN